VAAPLPRSLLRCSLRCTFYPLRSAFLFARAERCLFPRDASVLVPHPKPAFHPPRRRAARRRRFLFSAAGRAPLRRGRFTFCFSPRDAARVRRHGAAGLSPAPLSPLSLARPLTCLGGPSASGARFVQRTRPPPLSR
jgi:hypothetical protein